MKDRKPKYPGRVMLTPVEGQSGVYDMERADDPEEAGTPLNKNTFLTDETAEEMGLDPASDPTPNDALVALMARMLADGNGIMQKTMRMRKGDSNVGIMDDAGRKIFGYGTTGLFYVGDPDYPLTLRGIGGVPTYNGVKMAQVQTGTYRGTGSYGTMKNGNSLTFNSLPKFVIIYGVVGSWPHLLFAAPLYSVALYTKGSSSSNGGYCHVTWSGETMTWYNNSSVTIQMNEKDVEYTYFAVS